MRSYIEKMINLKSASIILAICFLFLAFNLAYRFNQVNLSEYKCPEELTQLQCWEELISNDLVMKGLDQAFETLAKLYATEPAFAAECHSFTHLLGEKAYQMFLEEGEIELTPKTSYCGYGFYHGFMETLLYNGGTVKEAQDLCAYAGEKLKKETSDAEGACYHGIGHGAVDGSDPRDWGDPKAMIEPGLVLCDIVASDREDAFGDLYRCISGAYNSLEILANDKKYGLDIINAAPFSFCATEPTFNLEACYTNMLPALFRGTKIDFEKTGRLIEEIPEKNNEYLIRAQVINSLFHEYVRENLDKNDFAISEGVTLCRDLSERSRVSCIEGLAGGHMKYGEPTKEHIKGLAFCSSSLLSDEEKDSCYSYILSRLRIWYTQEKTREICGQIDKQYIRYCSS